MPGGRSQEGLTSPSDVVGFAKSPNPNEITPRPLVEDVQRPTLAAGQNHQSVSSISQLHVPGEFPRSNVDARGGLDNLPV
jgi:hypothetical protein